jgi:predicted nucleic acid-binding protein
MAGAGSEDVILDTSVLVNFLAINRVDLLAKHPGYRFVVTGHVKGEVIYIEQAERLAQALSTGEVGELPPGTHVELATFAQLTVKLGVGESAAIAAAAHRSMLVSVEDKAARREAESLVGSDRVLNTTQLMVSLIQARLLTIAEADAIKQEWYVGYRFSLPKFASFGEIVPP